jgi:uncharacterized protein YoxC
MQGVKEAVQLSNTYGLGVVLAVINVMALISLVFYVVRSCHKEKSDLSKIINETLVTLNGTVNSKVAMINTQTALIQNVSESMREANRYNRTEHDAIMKNQQEIMMIIAKDK